MLVFKIVTAAEWRAAEQAGVFVGSATDVHDGFIHLSTAAQVCETAARHFTGQLDLFLVAFEAIALGPALKWEPFRGDALFPHLHGPLDRASSRGRSHCRWPPMARTSFCRWRMGADKRNPTCAYA